MEKKIQVENDHLVNTRVLDEYKHAFKLFDQDRDGKITAQELQQLMHALGQELSKREIIKLINRFDDDESGCIEFPEFLKMMNTKMVVVDFEEAVGEAFSVFDKKGNGFISATEMRHAMIHLGSRKKRLTNDDVDEMFMSLKVNDTVHKDSFISMRKD